LTKPRIYGKLTEKSKEVCLQNLVSILTKALGLLHPFMPFITEEINSLLSEIPMVKSKWPEQYPIPNTHPGVEKLELFAEIVSKVRVARSNQNVPPDKKCKVILKTESNAVHEIIKQENLSFLQLVKGESVEINNGFTPEKSDSISAFSKGEIILPLAGMIDMDKERKRLQKEKETLQSDIDKIEKKIGNPEFLSKAKPEVVQKEREKLEILQRKLETVEKGFEKLT
jgi:valyl-tRNA synthetase